MHSIHTVPDGRFIATTGNGGCKAALSIGVPVNRVGDGTFPSMRRMVLLWLVVSYQKEVMTYVQEAHLEGIEFEQVWGWRYSLL